MTNKITPEMEKQFLEDTENAISAPRSEHKLRITTMVDGDVLDELKLSAKKQGIGYQTLINMILREQVINKKETSIEQLEKQVKALTKLMSKKFPKEVKKMG